MKRTALFLALVAAAHAAGRITVSLDGDWEMADSVSGAELPRAWEHRAPVPGLADLAFPPFADVGAFDSRELIKWQVEEQKLLPLSALIKHVGIPRQQRNYFWYRRAFTTPARRQIALLKVNKAQFGAAVWLNGRKIGEHLGCFTAGYFNLTPAVRWNGANELVVRIGAHPAALPETVPAGTDFEKLRWIPGIYDSVSLILADNPVIEWVQVAPRLAASEIVVQTRLRNYGAAGSFALSHAVKTWKGGQGVARTKPGAVTLAAGEEKTVTERIAIPSPELWSPQSPFLYVLDTSTGGDSAATRFGMREFRFDTATKRAYLNGKLYFLRGSNITLHRFFEDTRRGRLPWNREWVRKLLVEVPKRMHWNSFRFCIGPVPDFWLDLADEAGLLIQNEFFIWTSHDSWDTGEMIAEYKEWMRDHWNHPSVAIWDASNETTAAVIPDTIIPAVRELDLSNRPWENGYNLPAGPDDPVEDHAYLFIRLWRDGKFAMTDLEKMTGAKTTNAPHPSGHAAILNEYGWLWLNRDGSATQLTGNVWAKLAPGSTPQQRLEMNAYLLAGLTEFWRAHRNYAAVLHFVYLTGDFPGNMTGDHFRDIEALELEPHFAEYVGEAFKPLGVYINFWQPQLAAGNQQRFPVMMVNDEAAPAAGKLALTLETEGGEMISSREMDFSLPAFGQHTYLLPLTIPETGGRAWLKAAAWNGAGKTSVPTISRRRVELTRP